MRSSAADALIISETENNRNFAEHALSMRLLIAVHLRGIVDAQTERTFEWNALNSVIVPAGSHVTCAASDWLHADFSECMIGS